MKTHLPGIWHIRNPRAVYATLDKPITCKVCRNLLSWKAYVEIPILPMSWQERLITYLSVLNKE